MTTYRIQFNESDSINIMEFKKGQEMPEHLDYNEVLNTSVKNGWVDSEEDINTLMDGSDNIEPGFHSGSPAEEARIILEDGADGLVPYHQSDVNFDPEVYEYDLS